jgi:hypothetical protein
MGSSSSSSSLMGVSSLMGISSGSLMGSSSSSSSLMGSACTVHLLMRVLLSVLPLQLLLQVQQCSSDVKQQQQQQYQELCQQRSRCKE